MALRVARKASTNQPQVLLKCYLDKLPLEILSEILLNTASPRDLLAVARCSKFFCAILVNNPATMYIWKHLRQKFHKIPEPAPNWTESSYAAFLFDGGACEECNKKLKSFPFSFALRLHLCSRNNGSSNDCIDKWLLNHAIEVSPAMVENRYRSLVLCLPSVELGSHATEELTTDGLRLVRKADWRNMMDAFNKASLEGTADAFVAAGTEKARQITDLESYCDDLLLWKTQRQREGYKLKETNDNFAKTTAQSEGWTYWDMKTSQSFSVLFRCKLTSEEPVTKADIDCIRPALEAEMIRVKERRVHQKEESEYAKARAAVERRYKALKAGNYVVPPLGDFKQLHTSQMVLKQSSAVKMLTDTRLDQPLIQEIDRWVSNARHALGKVLGFAGWKSASSSEVHIAERLNARFLCAQCQKSGKGVSRWDDPGLTFQEACKHSCPYLKKKQRAKLKWTGDNFVADVHCINAINQVFSVAGIDAAQENAKNEVSELKDRIVCRVCPTPLVMDFPAMMRHSRRHELVEFDVVTSEEKDAILKGALFTACLTERLRHRMGQSKVLRDKRVFGCRHCVSVGSGVSTGPKPRSTPENTDPSTTLSSEATDLDVDNDTTRTSSHDASSQFSAMVTSTAASRDVINITVQVTSQAGTNVKPEKSLLRQRRKKIERVSATYTFDGMRSHVKAKHGIAWIGDEDFYQVSE